ncbi:hypothetical protein C804_04562 [Lachnospiraceae bacterium A4]|jgi:peptide maturation system acyl carrier-related protein|nr:hypothetical protein C804_04562 [Lachnospiraceae bacterium A4]
MDKGQVSDKVKKIFMSLFQTEESKLVESYWTDNFFGSRLHILPGDVVAYLYAIEAEFGLQIPSAYILEGRFNSLDNVADIIFDILQKNGTCNVQNG